jgi:hypothetical protein
VSEKLEAGMIPQVFDIALRPREQIVRAYHLVATREQCVNQMRSEEAGPSRNENSPVRIVIAHITWGWLVC